MIRQEILAAIADERVHLVRDLDGLAPTDWDRPSLCDGWAVRDVVGHLVRVDTMYRYAVPFAVGLLRHGFRVNAFIAEDARRRAAGQSAASLQTSLDATRYEERIGARLHPVPATPLAEWVIHGQDIRRPLGISRTVPPDRLIAVADVLFARNGYPWGRRRRPSGRFEATDADWQRGSGDPIRAPLEEIVMRLAGRDVRSVN